MVSFIKRHYFPILITLCVLFNGYFNLLNIERIRTQSDPNGTINAGSLVHNQTIYSIDNEYYLSPVDNYKHGKGWKRSPGVSDGDYYRRVPGYSLVYLLFYNMFGSQNLWFFLKLFQFLLFTISIPLFFRTCGYLSKGVGQKIVTIIYAASPLIGGWVCYTITEGITPELMVFYLYFTYKGYQAIEKRKKTLFYSIAMILITYLVLTRPYTAIAGIIILAATLKDLSLLKRKFLPNFAVIFLFGFIGIGSWAFRNYRLTNDVVLLEQAYHPQSLDRMKPEFRGFLNFAKSWGEDGDQFNNYHQPFYFAALSGDVGKAPAEKLLSQLPPAVVSDFGSKRLLRIFQLHQQAILLQKPYFDQQKAQPDSYFKEQLQVEKEYDKLTQEYKGKHFFNYWIGSPVKYLQRMIVNSNTAHLFIFQGDLSIGLKLYKLLLFLVHVFIYAAILFNIFRIRKRFEWIVFVLTPLIFIVFFSLIHREIEQRYMLPVLPIILMGGSLVLTDLSNKLKAVFQKVSKKTT